MTSEGRDVEANPITPYVLATTMQPGCWYTAADLRRVLKSHAEAHHRMRAARTDPRLDDIEPFKRYLRGYEILIRRAVRNALRRKLLDAQRGEDGRYLYKLKDGIDPESLIPHLGKSRPPRCGTGGRQKVSERKRRSRFLRTGTPTMHVYLAIMERPGSSLEQLAATAGTIFDTPKGEERYFARLRHHYRGRSQEETDARIHEHKLLPDYHDKRRRYLISHVLNWLRKKGNVDLIGERYYIRGAAVPASAVPALMADGPRRLVLLIAEVAAADENEAQARLDSFLGATTPIVSHGITIVRATLSTVRAFNLRAYAANHIGLIKSVEGALD